MKTGIIGVGNMGRIITEAMLDEKAVSPSDMTIVNRSKKKPLSLKIYIQLLQWLTNRHMWQSGPT